MTTPRIAPATPETSSSAGYRSVWTHSARAPRAELFHVLMLPDFDRVDAIGTFWGHPETRTFGEMLIDCEEDKFLRAVLVAMLREGPTRE